MTGRNMNIYFQEETFSKIKSLIAKREISRFINEAVEEKLQKRQQTEKEQLRQKLIIGYQARTKNEELQNRLQTYGKMSWVDITTELTRREKKNGKSNK